MVPGGGQGNTNSGAGGYGGAGANGADYPSQPEQGGQPYGSAVNPLNLGSGGGGGYNNTAGLRRQRRRRGDHHRPNGSPQRNDRRRRIGRRACASGAGAGGTVNVQAANLSGTGAISANGGHNPNRQLGARAAGGASGSRARRSTTSPALVRRRAGRTEFRRKRSGRDHLLLVFPAAPTITSIAPNSGATNNSALPVTVTGSNFLSGSGTTLKLTKTGQPDNFASNVVGRARAKSRRTSISSASRRGRGTSWSSTRTDNPRR